jgi:hypothetical protein
MLIALLLAAAPASLELDVAGGVALPLADTPQNGPGAPALQARAGADLFEHLTVSAALLGVAGAQTARPFCASPCKGNASFRAISGFLALRLHTAGDLQAFVEGGIGPGHLISVSPDDLFENPPQHGRGGPAYLVAVGGRGFVSRQLALGLEVAWTKWTNVSRPAFVSGATSFPARSDLSVDAIALLVVVSWSAGRSE